MAEPSTSSVTVFDIDQLVTGATPQFSQQILERVKALVAPLGQGDPVREYAEIQMHVLERLATGTTRGTRALGVPDADDESWAMLPSRPHGGIAPGASDGGH